MRPETVDKIGNFEFTTKGVAAIGGGARVDIFFNRLFGLNLGFELLGGKADVDGKDDWGARIDLFGPVFYGGVTFSF